MQYEMGVVIPVYNSEHTIGAVVRQLLCYFHERGLTHQIVLVNDGSLDGSGHVIKQLAHTCKAVIAVQLRHNCGQQNALLCGLRLLSGCRLVVTMDDDLQHPAQVLDVLHEKIQQGFDLVYAIPQGGERRRLYRRIGSRLRDILFSLLTAKPRGVSVSAYRIMTAELVAKICAEQPRFFYLSASALRYAPRVGNVPFTPRARVFGRSGYTLRKLTLLYRDLLFGYTAAGRWLCRPRLGHALYEVAAITKGGSGIGNADDSGWLQLPAKCAKDGAAAGA